MTEGHKIQIPKVKLGSQGLEVNSISPYLITLFVLILAL